MRITSHDVARLAGVSQPTVSRALRDDPRVSAATREKVWQAAAALDYVPSEAGRSLATRATRRIGIVVTDLTNPFYPHLVAPLHDELEAHGYRMTLLTERTDAAMASERLLDRSIDGAVLTTSVLGSPLPAELQRRELPFVFLNREGAPGLGDAAVADNAGGGRLAAQELLALGHRRIAGIFGPSDTSTGRDRELGFRLALADAGVGLREEHTWRGPFEFETGEQCLLALLERSPRPTAVFCGNDVIAIGVLNAARRAGVRVPEDLTVIGFDDMPIASWEVFRLTTVRHDVHEMARTAARLLVERVSGKETGPPRRVVFDTELVRRATHAAA
ncbi:LacI family DNA-binding transcriptional regulator [Pseudonocardia nigra]|uniref:LacI family DNA-binding transcriptional regulator n=1 Tax=Pseudonocardia nigra TaxID=1921578 RepID=UPI001C5CE988|nr:LacI family DNA-binding transcriptional regulator [Pseudonocardia nigra]